MSAKNGLKITGTLQIILVMAFVFAGGWILRGLWGAIFSVGVLLGTIFWISQYLFSMYELESRMDAFSALLAFLFNINLPHVVVEEGRIAKKTKGSMAKMGGPGVLVVKNDSVVATELGTNHWVRGPGVHVIKKRNEKVKEMIDLRPQAREGTVKAMTKDGFEIEMDFFVGFQLDPYIGEPRTEGTYPYSDEAVRRAVYDSKQVGTEGAKYWHERIPDIVYANVRELIATHHLNDFLAPENPEHKPRDRFKAQLKQETMGPARAYGAKINWINFSTPRIPDETTRKFIERYGAELQGKIKETEARAQRQAIEIIIEALDHLDEEAQVDQLLRLRFIEALERMSKDPSTKVVWPYDPNLPKLESL